jgi:hypothetical protein
VTRGLPRISLPIYVVVTYSSSWSSSRLRRLPAHRRPEPLVISSRAIAPIGTTFSTPVKAVPPGDTVVGATLGLRVVVGATLGLAVVVDSTEALGGCQPLLAVF